MLRKRIGYRGIILSDDLEMGGILKFMPMEEAAVAAVRAGSDLAGDLPHPGTDSADVYEALIAEGERSAAFRKLLLARARESAAEAGEDCFRRRCRRRSAPKQFEALRARILRFGETIAANGCAIDRGRLPAETHERDAR